MNNIHTIILSDVHIGSEVGKPKLVLEILKKYKNLKELIINGDLIDSGDTRRLKREDWEILSEIRKMTKKMKVYWIRGNHCRNVADLIGGLLGAITCEELIKSYGNNRVYITHGDVFDNIICNNKNLTNIFCHLYRYIQLLDIHNQNFARFLKRKSKKFIRATEKVKEKAIKHAKGINCNVAILGHVHHAESDFLKNENFHYLNCGSFTEAAGHCSYVTIGGDDNVIKLNYI